MVLSIIYPVQWIQVALLLAMVGLSGILIVITSKRWIMIYWMLIYLTALPFWNFILPIYSFWHFDDFSWGETRKVQGEKKGESHEDNVLNELGYGIVQYKLWEEWELDRRQMMVETSRSSFSSSNKSIAHYP